MASMVETEVKIAVRQPEAIRDLLRARGFHESVSRRFEANTLYDTPDARLRQTELRGRIITSSGGGGAMAARGTPITPAIG